MKQPQKDYDPQLEKEREDFLKQLELNWNNATFRCESVK